VTGSSSKVTRAAKMLMGVRKYVSKNIKKRLGIIMEALQISIEASVVTGQIHLLKDFLQKDLQTDCWNYCHLCQMINDIINFILGHYNTHNITNIGSYI
jgi:hypothetical protein